MKKNYRSKGLHERIVNEKSAYFFLRHQKNNYMSHSRRLYLIL